jgi:hypothetical protein
MKGRLCPMKVNVWRKAVDRSLLPALPGRWQVIPWRVCLDQIDWFVSALCFSLTRSRLQVIGLVQFLPTAAGFWNPSVHVEIRGPVGHWDAPAEPEEASEVMRAIAPVAVAKALPFFEANANVEARLAYLLRRVASLDERMGGGGWQNFNVDEELTYVHLLRGDLCAAETAAAWTARAAAEDGGPWAIEANARTQRVMAAAMNSIDDAKKVMRQQANLSRTALKLNR